MEDPKKENEESDIGKIIKNKYKIIDKIGGGSFGKVHLVEENETKKLFAIKESKNKSCITFEREKNALNKLSEHKKKNKITKEDSYTIDMIDNFDEKKITSKGSEVFSYIVLEFKQKYNLYDYLNFNKTFSFYIHKLYILL